MINKNVMWLGSIPVFALIIFFVISSAACGKEDKTLIPGNADSSEQAQINENFEQDIRSFPNEKLYNFGVELYDANENERATLVFNECIRRNVNRDDSWFRLGVAFTEMGRTNEGLEAFLQTVKLNPDHAKAHFNLGAIYYDLRDFQKSIDSYERANVLTPNDDEAIYGIAASQYALGMFNEANANTQKAMKLNPNNHNASILLKMLAARN